MSSKTRWFFSAFYKGNVFICMGLKGKIHEFNSSVMKADAIYFVKRGEFLAVANYEDSKVALISLASLSERIITCPKKVQPLSYAFLLYEDNRFLFLFGFSYCILCVERNNISALNWLP